MEITISVILIFFRLGVAEFSQQKYVEFDANNLKKQNISKTNRNTIFNKNNTLLKYLTKNLGRSTIQIGFMLLELECIHLEKNDCFN